MIDFICDVYRKVLQYINDERLIFHPGHSVFILSKIHLCGGFCQNHQVYLVALLNKSMTDGQPCLEIYFQFR